MKNRNWSLDSLVLIFSIIVVAQLLGYAVPQGRFERQPYPDNPSREMVVAGTYDYTAGGDSVTLPPWHFLVAIPNGFAAAQDIIFLIFIITDLTGATNVFPFINPI